MSSKRPSKRKRADPITGLDLPVGVLYAAHAASSPYQAQWQNEDGKQKTKCFKTVEEAVAFRHGKMAEIEASRKLGNAPNFTSATSHQIEEHVLSRFATLISEFGVETRFWQAGTRSDFGHRPRGMSADLWLPVQAKTTLAQKPPYKFFLRGEYDMYVVCIPGHLHGCFFVSSAFLRENQHHLYSGKCLYVAKNSRFNLDLFKWNSYSETILGVWNSELELHRKDVKLQRTGPQRKSRLRPEMELRMQCTPNSQIEIVLQALLIKFDSTRRHAWPSSPNGHVDRFIDDLRIQDKTVRFAQGSASFTAKLTKKQSGKQVPYAEGDVDVFVFATVHEGLRLLISWEIPTEALSARGFLETDHCKGRTSIVLPIADAEGNNADLEKHLFPSSVFKGDRFAASYLKIQKLPVEYEIPECLCGRHS